MCLFLQGRKEASFGGRNYKLGLDDCWLISHDVPIVARINEAPSLSILFEVDSSTLGSLYDELADAALDTIDAQAFGEHRADAQVVEALNRYLALTTSSADTQILGPMVSRELHYRLVMSPFGGCYEIFCERTVTRVRERSRSSGATIENRWS